ncbi:MAG: right-handed parallel beta-helix repeat-containing protein [Planctomycetota bacterium]|jgi:hypothetical protein
MRINKILKITIMILFAFVFNEIALSSGCNPPVITSPNDNDIFFAGKTYTDICQATGDPVISWSGPGTFDPTTGSPVSWTAPTTTGNVTITATNSYGSDQVTVKVQNMIYVDITATGNDNGTTWTDAFDTIGEAISASVAGNEIWVADGTYTLSSTLNVNKAIGIYGGFEGDETSRGQEKSGGQREGGKEGGQNDVIVDGGGVVRCLYVTGDATIDSFTIRNGYTYNGDGAGMAVYNCSPTVSNCTFTNNNAGHSVNGDDADGGGMHNKRSSPTVTNCVFNNNAAGDDGGGLCNKSGSNGTFTNCVFSNNFTRGCNDGKSDGGGVFNTSSERDPVCSNPTFTNCVFTGNSTVRDGGGACDVDQPGTAGDPTPTYTNCVFYDNSAGDDGGGISIKDGADTTLTNCVFVDNSSSGDGGGAHNSKSSTNPSYINCTFNSNSAGDDGGGIAVKNGSSTTVTNCILWDDQAIDNDDEIFVKDATITVTYSDVEGDYTGDGNIDSDPKFGDSSDPDGGDNTFRTHDDGLRLDSDSPCIDAGNNNAISKSTDIVGNDRKIDGDDDATATVDMGAYECVPIAVTHIKFNHSAGDSADGIDIRENYSTDITVPEWVEGGQNKPAAYKKSTSVTIKAKFYIRPTTITSAKIKATTTDSIFGNLGEQTVTFSGGVSDYISFTPTNSTPSAIDKGTVTWQWKIRDIQGGGSPEYDFGSSGSHTIYTVLATPQAPQAEPWTQVLDKSCVWASGEQQNDSVLEELASDLYTSGLTYNGFQSHYKFDQWPPTKLIFDLTDFFSDWQDADCQDCAMFLSCLSGSLGCTLTDVRRITGGFLTKDILAIGDSTWNPNSWNFHQIGWDQNVYDACLKLKETDPYLPVDVDIDNPYKTDLFDFGNWTPETPFTLISDNDPYYNYPTDVN